MAEWKQMAATIARVMWPARCRDDAGEASRRSGGRLSWRERFQAFVISAFRRRRLLLAMLGIYGVLSYSVAPRMPEIDIRMALGASRAAICRQVVRNVAAPVAGGLTLGLLASAGAFRLVEKFLYDQGIRRSRDRGGGAGGWGFSGPGGLQACPPRSHHRHDRVAARLAFKQ